MDKGRSVMGKVVLAYSGGLDTSVAIHWIREKYNLDVVALTVDVGNERDLKAIQQRALKIGASKALIVDGKDLFVRYFVLPALRAGAVYQGHYLLATALARPLIAKFLVDVARQENAEAVAHGCTGKGNDQVRFDLTIGILAPELRIIAPMREWAMTREEEIEYALRHDIPVELNRASPFSIDQNLWGRSIEAGVLEDPWAEPPPEAFKWTSDAYQAPDEPAYLEIDFEEGFPVGLNGERLQSLQLISRLNELGGIHGVGRVDEIEDRLIGIKSREVYEAPAATILFSAHQALEKMTLSREQLRFKSQVAAEIAVLIYNGLWFSALHQDLAAFVASTQRNATGTVRLKLFKGNCQIVGRKSQYALYSRQLATYGLEDRFDHGAAVGFIKLWGLSAQTQAHTQMLARPEDLPLLEVADVDEKSTDV